MHRVIFNDYVDATLAALFVAVVVAITVYGLIAIRRAWGNPNVTAIEVELAGAGAGAADD
jgi:carbon starvation protein